MISDLHGCDGGRLIADVNVLAKAGAAFIEAKGAWPEVPPTLRPIDAAAISICFDANEWELWISPELRRLTRLVMLGEIGDEFAGGLSLSDGAVSKYLTELDRVVELSGGESIRPRMRVTNLSGDNEDDANVASLASSMLGDVVISWDGRVHGLRKRDLPIAGGGCKEVRFVTAGDFVQHVHNVRTAQGGW